MLYVNRGNIEIVEVEIRKNSLVAGKEVKSLNLPAEALIISVIRDGHAILPAGDTVFSIGDSVIALVGADKEHELRIVFGENSD